MSVAFRRENDDEHLEPKFEVPIAPGPNLVTPRGLRLIAAKLAELDAAIAGEADEAARNVLKRDHRYWGTRLSTAQVAEPPPTGEVAIGSRVKFRLNGKIRTIDIVGGDEADAAHDRIAFSAPLARALIGGEVGETVDFGDRTDALEILATTASPDAD
ncbi:GreA/GreB family elongation factor [Sphingomonas donggukensis]|uniref:GreA/GreB family elongation factor n=1 Tax=Sphingomonas donggukensis TaxID=2949093 RepID=A0ABY4TSV9_9SPHN|nr:GreA/GreB family elongation factor [Sphingomonas donggukensis]URW75497.1 GreA/GreB family elongation factor [Sphingomonas donggukensis]